MHTNLHVAQPEVLWIAGVYDSLHHSLSWTHVARELKTGSYSPVKLPRPEFSLPHPHRTRLAASLASLHLQTFSKLFLRMAAF